MHRKVISNQNEAKLSSSGMPRHLRNHSSADWTSAHKTELSRIKLNLKILSSQPFMHVHTSTYTYRYIHTHTYGECELLHRIISIDHICGIGFCALPTGCLWTYLDTFHPWLKVFSKMAVGTSNLLWSNQLLAMWGMTRGPHLINVCVYVCVCMYQGIYIREFI